MRHRKMNYLDHETSQQRIDREQAEWEKQRELINKTRGKTLREKLIISSIKQIGN